MTAVPETDLLTFQSEVEAILRPLHMRREAPGAAVRAQGIQFACLGPIILVGVAFLLLFGILPTLQSLTSQGGGVVAVVVLSGGLFLLARWLGKLNQQQQRGRVGQYMHMLDELIQLEPDNPIWQTERTTLAAQSRVSVSDQERIRNLWEQTTAKHAAALLERTDVLACICPVLLDKGGDVFAFARRIAGALHRSVTDGQLAAVLTPIVVAHMALLIDQRGIAQVCATHIEHVD